MAYHLEGQLLEVCDCRVLCPCWIGEAPDNGTCKGFVAWHFQKGSVDGVDVSGLTFGAIAHIPGNVLKGNWRVAMFIDERATEAQFQALLSVYKGERGGPVAELGKLIGEVVSVERAAIKFTVRNGKGMLSVGDDVHADMEPYVGPHGEPTKLVESIFSTIPGSPAYVSKAGRYRARNAKLGYDVDLKGHNAIQGHFSFQA